MTASTAEIIPLPTANLPADLDGLGLAPADPQLDDLAAQILANCKEHYARSEEMFSNGRVALKALQDVYDREHFTPLRIARGRLLLEAQKLVPKGQWQKWCAEKLNRNTSWSFAYQFPDGPLLGRITLTSQRDLRACMELARAADPIAAHEEEKARARDGMRKVRKQRRNAQAVTPAVATQSKRQEEQIQALFEEHGVTNMWDLRLKIPLEPGCCNFHDTGGSLNFSCGNCNMGGQRQDASLDPANASPTTQPEPSVAVCGDAAGEIAVDTTDARDEARISLQHLPFLAALVEFETWYAGLDEFEQSQVLDVMGRAPAQAADAAE